MAYGCVGGAEENKPMVSPVAGLWTSTGTILVLYILLVIILKTCWI